MRKILEAYLSILLLVKKMYRIKNSDTTSSAVVASSYLFFFNLVTIAGILNHFLIFFDLEYDSKFELRGIKILITVTLVASIMVGMDFLRKRIKPIERYALYKKLIKRTPGKSIALLYMITSVVLLVFVLIKFYVG